MKLNTKRSIRKLTHTHTKQAEKPFEQVFSSVKCYFKSTWALAIQVNRGLFNLQQSMWHFLQNLIEVFYICVFLGMFGCLNTMKRNK